MITITMENFKIKDIKGGEKDDGWIFESSDTNFVAKCKSENGECVAEFILLSKGYTYRVYTLKQDEYGEEKIGKMIKSKSPYVDTNNGTGTVQLGGGPVSKRWATYSTPVFSLFKKTYDIDIIKRVNFSSFDYGFILEDTNLKRTDLHLPDQTNVSYIYNSDKKDIIRKGAVCGPYYLAGIEGSTKIVNIKNFSRFFVFDEYFKKTGNKKRTLYIKNGVNVYSIASQLNKILPALLERQW